MKYAKKLMVVPYVAPTPTGNVSQLDNNMTKTLNKRKFKSEKIKEYNQNLSKLRELNDNKTLASLNLPTNVEYEQPIDDQILENLDKKAAQFEASKKVQDYSLSNNEEKKIKFKDDVNNKLVNILNTLHENQTYLNNLYLHTFVNNTNKYNDTYHFTQHTGHYNSPTTENSSPNTSTVNSSVISSKTNTPQTLKTPIFNASKVNTSIITSKTNTPRNTTPIIKSPNNKDNNKVNNELNDEVSPYRLAYIEQTKNTPSNNTQINSTALSQKINSSKKKINKPRASNIGSISNDNIINDLTYDQTEDNGPSLYLDETDNQMQIDESVYQLPDKTVSPPITKKTPTNSSTILLNTLPKQNKQQFRFSPYDSINKSRLISSASPQIQSAKKKLEFNSPNLDNIVDVEQYDRLSQLMQDKLKEKHARHRELIKEKDQLKRMAYDLRSRKNFKYTK